MTIKEQIKQNEENELLLKRIEVLIMQLSGNCDTEAYREPFERRLKAVVEYHFTRRLT